MVDADYKFLSIAIDLAAESVRQGGFPAGSVLVQNDTVVAEGISIGGITHDPTSHSDVAAIRAACAKGRTSVLSGAVLYSSVQPCLMCLGASAWAGVSKIFYACAQDKIDAAYYGGRYNSNAINESLVRPLVLSHYTPLEEASLKIVRGWEQSPKALS